MKLIIDVPEEQYRTLNAKTQNDVVTIIDTRLLIFAIKNGTPLDDIRSKMMYEIYMDGVNMANEYHGCWVRFKNIEKIVDKHIGERTVSECGK